MDIRQWARQSVARVRRDGIDGLRTSARPVYNKLLEGENYLRKSGVNV